MINDFLFLHNILIFHAVKDRNCFSGDSWSYIYKAFDVQLEATQLSDLQLKLHQRSFEVMKESIFRYSYYGLAQDGHCDYQKESYVPPK